MVEKYRRIGEVIFGLLTFISTCGTLITVMTNSIKLLLTSLVSYVTGLLTVTGHLDQGSSNSLSIGFQDIIGGILIIAPILYNLEHHSKTPTTTVATTEPVTTITSTEVAPS